MGVYVDQYVGYFIDISEDEDALIARIVESEKQRLGSKFNDEYLYDFDAFEECLIEGNNIPAELSSLGFKPHYSHNGKEAAGRHDIEIVRDGMSGNYQYLVYIEDVDRYSDNESEPLEAVNEALRKTPIPDEVFTKLAKVYKYLFRKELDKSKVFMQQLAHFH